MLLMHGDAVTITKSSTGTDVIKVMNRVQITHNADTESVTLEWKVLLFLFEELMFFSTYVIVSSVIFLYQYSKFSG